MKKIIGSIILSIVSIALVVAQENQKVLKVDTLKPAQILYRTTPCSHWSFSLNGGVDNFLMSPDAPTYMDRFNPTGGVVLEYTCNPFIGLGMEYTYSDYSRPYTYMNALGKLEGATNDLLLFGSVNLSNALSPCRAGVWQRWNVYAKVGGGMAMFKGALDGATADYQTALVGMLGLHAEYYLSRTLNFVLGGEYHQYDALFMGGGSKSNRNGDALMATLGLRFKFASKRKAHARNIAVRDFTPEPSPIIVRKTVMNAPSEEVLVRLKTAENIHADLKAKLQKLEKEASQEASE